MPETRVAEVAKAVAADVFDQPMHMQNGIFTQRISLFRKTMVYSGAYASTNFILASFSQSPTKECKTNMNNDMLVQHCSTFFDGTDLTSK